MKILLAEDHEDTAVVYKLALQDKGHVVVHTTNGEDCLKVYHNEFQIVTFNSNPKEHIQPFDAVILDYNMPRMNGLEVAKEILANLKSPSRLRTVTLHIPEVNTEEKIASKLAAEHSYHSTFHSFGGSLLCAYPIEQIEPKKRGKWIEGILQNHHSAIFVTKSGRGLAFHLEKQ